MSLLLVAPTGAMAQDASADPSPSTGDTDIAFPLTIGDQELSPETWSGSEWLDQFDGDDAVTAIYKQSTESLVEDLGKTLDDLTVKSALYEPSEGNHAVVAAFQVAGTDAREFVADAVQVLLGDLVEPELLLRPVADKWALRVVDASMPGVYPRTVYLKDDVAWIIEGDEDYVWDALDQLPDATPEGELTDDTLFTRTPLVLDGRRRAGLYEAVEPLFLPTLSGRLGDAVEPWLLDAYLGEGISPAAMVGLLAWWGITRPEESVQIEGYQLPGGSAELVERLRSEILLAEGSGTPGVSVVPDPDDPTAGEEELFATDPLAGIERVAQEIGGREVTSLDLGDGVHQHIFSSGDTVWVVTDYVGEPEMAAEAIAELP
jgi:hypothetical protein